MFSRAETLATPGPATLGTSKSSRDTVSLAYKGKGDRSGGVEDEKLPVLKGGPLNVAKHVSRKKHHVAQN